MTEKRRDFNMEDKKNVKDNVEVNVETNLIKSLKYQSVSINYWGEGQSDDELLLGYDY